jgi:hypothetical protein
MDLKNKMANGFKNLFSFSIINVLIIVILIIIIILSYLQNNKLELLTLQSIIEQKTDANEQKKKFKSILGTQGQIIKTKYDEYKKKL